MENMMNDVEARAVARLLDQMRRFPHARVFTVDAFPGEAKSGLGLFSHLSEAEIGEYRRWARENYKTFEPINGVWHPAVQFECVTMNAESGYAPRGAPPGP